MGGYDGSPVQNGPCQTVRAKTVQNGPVQNGQVQRVKPPDSRKKNFVQ